MRCWRPGCPPRLPCSGALELLGTGLRRDAADLVRIVDALPDATARSAFIRTLRGVVDWRGQVVTMLG